jgi:riboflavin-specific deaminase-like protein
LTGKVLRLYPLPAREVSAIYEDMDLLPAGRRDDWRPYVVLNIVGSIDGRAAVEGKASRLGSETDRQTMRTLRSKADAVMVGAGTLRAERLTLGVDAPAGPHPLAVIVTSSGDVPLESNLIVPERQEVLVIAPENVTIGSGKHRVVPLPADRSGNPNLGVALEVLRAEHGVDLLLVEGGPSLNHSFLSRGLVDELFLTLAPNLIAGTLQAEPTIINGPVLLTSDINLLSIHLCGDELYLRYNLRQAR